MLKLNLVKLNSCNIGCARFSPFSISGLCFILKRTFLSSKIIKIQKTKQQSHGFMHKTTSQSAARGSKLQTYRFKLQHNDT